MSLVVITGAVRSGKSSAAEALAASRGLPVVAAVAGWDGDEEMARRIEAHRAARDAAATTLVVGPDPSWVEQVGDDAVLVLDCLATLVGAIAWEEAGDAEVASADVERAACARTDALVEALVRRAGDTVVVTNEAGWGVVPASAAGRLFRDLLGRANRMLIDSADGAWLALDGRFMDVAKLPDAPGWPDR